MASTPEPLTIRSARVRHAGRLATRAFRAKTGEFLAEGPQAVREALGVPGVVLEVFATAEAARRHPDLVALGAEVTWHEVGDAVVAHVAEAVTPQGMVARCRSVLASWDDVLGGALRHVVVCANVRDPGNAGAVIRVADAVAADAVVLAGESVDPLSPKAVRASVGSVFHLPVVVERDVAAVVTGLREHGVRVLAADGEGESELFDPSLDLARPTAWLLGNEAWGLPPDLWALADQVVSVPIHGRAESLNLATAAAVCLYATAQAQRAG